MVGIRETARIDGSSNVASVHELIKEFLMPVLDTLKVENAGSEIWEPGGPWMEIARPHATSGFVNSLRDPEAQR
jgi:hypothetical protein